MKHDDQPNQMPPRSLEAGFSEREDDALWSLLGQASPPVVSPFFSRNVVREVRQHTSAWARIVALRWRFAPAAAALALLTCVTMTQIMGGGHVTKSPAQTERKDYEVINNLDNLLAAEESSLWLDDSDQ